MGMDGLSQAVGSYSFSLLTSGGGKKSTCKEIVWLEPELQQSRRFTLVWGLLFIFLLKADKLLSTWERLNFQMYLFKKTLHLLGVSFPFLPYSESQNVLFFSERTHDT